MSDVRHSPTVSVRNSWGIAQIVSGLRIETNIDRANRTATATLYLLGGTNANRATLYARTFDCHINGVNLGHGPTINTINSPKNGLWTMELGKSSTITVHYDNDGNAPPQHITASWTMRGDIGINGTPVVDGWLHFPKIDPAYTRPANPTISPNTSQANELTVDVATTSFGMGILRYLYAYTKEGGAVVYSNILNDNGTVTIRGLTPNKDYLITSRVENGAFNVDGQQITMTTLASSEISDVRIINGRKADVDVLVHYGGGKYVPTTVLELKKKSEDSWRKVGQTKSTTKETFHLINLDQGSEYELRVKTTTTAGEWVGGARSITMPSNVAADIEKVVNRGVSVADVHFTASSLVSETVNVEAFYRRSGRDDDWAKTEKVKAINEKGKFVIGGLVPGLVSYDIYLVAVDGLNNKFTSRVKQFKSGAGLKPIENHNCKSLAYINELICQSLESIKRGNIYIYANDETKEDCDDDSQIPTLTSILSRVRRAYDAYACILCFVHVLPKGKQDEYYSAETGWRKLTSVAAEGDDTLITPVGAKKELKKIENSSWHFDGVYDYLTNSLDLMTDKGSNDETLVLVAKNKPSDIYKKVNGVWTKFKDGADQFENMSVIKISKDSPQETPNDLISGVVSGSSMFYMFNNVWHRMDQSSVKIKDEIELTKKLQAPLVNFNPVNQFNKLSLPQAKVFARGATTEEPVMSDYMPLGLDGQSYMVEASGSGNLEVFLPVSVPHQTSKGFGYCFFAMVDYVGNTAPQTGATLNVDVGGAEQDGSFNSRDDRHKIYNVTNREWELVEGYNRTLSYFYFKCGYLVISASVPKGTIMYIAKPVISPSTSVCSKRVFGRIKETGLPKHGIDKGSGLIIITGERVI